MAMRAPRRPLARLLALLLPALVAGCEDMPVTSVAFRIEDPWAIAQGAMPLPVIVEGRALSLPPGRFAEMVVRTMGEAITWSRNARFVLVPAESAGQALRLVVVFNGSGRAGCGSTGPGGAPEADGSVRMQAVFCDGDRLLADVSGRLKRSDGRNDRPVFSLIRQVTADLLRPPAAPRP
jgi:hypothetical protein